MAIRIATAHRRPLSRTGAHAPRSLSAVWLLCSLACAAALALGTPSAAHADWSAFGEDYPAISAVEAIIVDGDGNVVYSREPDGIMSMASVTKVMTAVVAIESGVALDTTFTITNSVTELDPESSIVGYTPGETVTLAEMLQGLLVHSGNDAALSIAECVAGSESAFVDMMNAKAAELGLANTRFANPHGLDQEGHYSTPADLVALGRHAMQLPLFASIVGSTATTISIGGVPTTFTSTDKLLNVYPGMRGIKTGYTYGAGNAFLGVATRGGQTFYVAVLGNESSSDRWADVSAMLDWAFARYPSYNLLSSDGEALGYVPFADRFGLSVSTSVEATATARTSPLDASSSLDADVSLASTSLVTTGSQIGQITWSDEDGTVSSRSILTSGAPVATQTFGPFVSDVFYG